MTTLWKMLSMTRVALDIHSSDWYVTILVLYLST